MFVVMVSDNSGDEVVQDLRVGGLDGVDVCGGEEYIKDGFVGGFGVKEGEE